MIHSRIPEKLQPFLCHRMLRAGRVAYLSFYPHIPTRRPSSGTSALSHTDR